MIMIASINSIYTSGREEQEERFME